MLYFPSMGHPSSTSEDESFLLGHLYQRCNYFIDGLESRFVKGGQTGHAQPHHLLRRRPPAHPHDR
jgi:hypothetical protein